MRPVRFDPIKQHLGLIEPFSAPKRSAGGTQGEKNKGLIIQVCAGVEMVSIDVQPMNVKSVSSLRLVDQQLHSFSD
jgi:hypothetical protein